MGPESVSSVPRPLCSVLHDAEAHAEHLLLARGERREHLPRLLGEVHVDDRVGGRDDGLVLDEVAEVAVLLLADGRLERDGLLRDLEDLADLVERQLHLERDLLRRRLATQVLHQVAARPDELVDGLDHVDRDADGPGLVGDGARDGLPDPPGGVRRELVAALVLELVDRLHEADVALLDEVQELQAAVGVLLRDRHHQAQVRLLQHGHDLADGGADHAIEVLQLIGREPELLQELLLLALVGAGVAEHALQLLDRHVDAPLAVDELALRLLHPLDEALQLRDDAVDLLLVELDGLQILDHLHLDGLDVGLELLALHLGHLLRGERLLDLDHVLLELADAIDVLEDVLDLLLLVARELGRRRLGPLDERHHHHRPLGALDRSRPGRLHLGFLDLVDLLRRGLVAGVLDDLADADLALLQPLSEIQDLLDGDGRGEHRGEDLLLALLDALRDLDLALAGEQGDRPHLAQVHAHRVVGLAVAGVLLLLLLRLLLVLRLGRLWRLVRQLHLLGVVDHLDVVVAEHRHDVVDLLRGDDVGRQGVVHLVVGEEALVAAALHERLDLGALGELGIGLFVVVVRCDLLLVLLLRLTVLGLVLVLLVRAAALLQALGLGSRLALGATRALGLALRRLLLPLQLGGLALLLRLLGGLLRTGGPGRLRMLLVLRLRLARRARRLGSLGRLRRALLVGPVGLGPGRRPDRLLRLLGSGVGLRRRHGQGLLALLGSGGVLNSRGWGQPAEPLENLPQGAFHPRSTSSSRFFTAARRRQVAICASASSCGTGVPARVTASVRRSCSCSRSTSLARNTDLRSARSAVSVGGRAGPSMSFTWATPFASRCGSSRAGRSAAASEPASSSRTSVASGVPSNTERRCSSPATSASWGKEASRPSASIAGPHRVRVRGAAERTGAGAGSGGMSRLTRGGGAAAARSISAESTSGATSSRFATRSSNMVRARPAGTRARNGFSSAKAATFCSIDAWAGAPAQCARTAASIRNSVSGTAAARSASTAARPRARAN